ncbi:MAG: hypothetical protein QOF62_2865 [Pyrinomonadaceae bacterium]|jgi:hypothetical protein|nr:hypothetical protein [Pyrinomonadaceae bacterium]
MKIEATEFLPLARREAIITKEVDGELLVYDVARDKAHCLNETAAAIWQLCDGRTSVAAISEQLAVGSGQRDGAVGSRQTADGSRQMAEGGRQLAEGSRQSADGSRQPAADFSLSTQHSALSTSPQPALSTSQQPTPDTRHPTPNPTGSRHLASKASDTRHPAPDTNIVWLALDQLRRSHLLEETDSKKFWPPAIAGITNMSRREAVRRIGLGAGIALPIVMSMTAPTAVEAAVSCKHHCDPCATSAECCGVCSTTTPGCTGSLRCS